jgi:single-stranded-DNA-specific exonuclease
MVYKFCCYLDSLLNLKYADEFTDLATVGIEADVMNLKDLEVRTIINKGMSGFKNPLLKAMVQKDKFHFAGKELTPFNITWYISPFINAISRTGTIEEKYIVFSSMIEYLAEQTVPSTKRGSKPGDLELLIEQALRVCTNVKNR